MGSRGYLRCQARYVLLCGKAVAFSTFHRQDAGQLAGRSASPSQPFARASSSPRFWPAFHAARTTSCTSGLNRAHATSSMPIVGPRRLPLCFLFVMLPAGRFVVPMKCSRWSSATGTTVASNPTPKSQLWSDQCGFRFGFGRLRWRASIVISPPRAVVKAVLAVLATRRPSNEQETAGQTGAAATRTDVARCSTTWSLHCESPPGSRL